jgi:membrane-bound lytic murein transglycosylase A
MAAAGASATPLSPESLAGFAADDLIAFWPPFSAQCQAILNHAAPVRPGAPLPPGLLPACQAATALPAPDDTAIRAFLGRWFQPIDVVPASGAGFLTGYYEPEVAGALASSDTFSAPLLERPDDLVTIPQGEVWPGVPEGFAAARQSADGFEPYPDRAAIEGGALGDKARPIAWLRDAVEVFMMQVQGSGRVRLADGRVIRIAYAGRSGHPYTSVGRAIVLRGLATPEQLTLEPLKAFLRADAARGRELMRLNRSYVFFRRADEVPEHTGPIGGAGQPLTAWRSLAVDRGIWAYGLPIWIDVALPLADGATEPFRRLTVAQDTGSAIVGPARADLFHGSGEEAGRRAGDLRHPMRFVVFWPRREPLP